MANKVPQQYSLGQLKWLAENQGGLNPQQASIAAAIAAAESSGLPGNTGFDSNGTIDRGLWQINTVHVSDNPTTYGNQDVYTPYGNATAMAGVSNGGTDWSPWTTYNTGAYQQYLAAAQAAKPVPVSNATGTTVYQPQTGGKAIGGSLLSELTKLGGSIKGIGSNTIASGGVDLLPFGNIFATPNATTSSTGVDIAPGAWLIAVNDLLNPKGPSLEQTILSLGTENVAEVTEMIFMRAVGAIIGFALIGFGLAAGFGAHPVRPLVGATPVTRRLRQIFSSSGNTDRQAIANSDRRQALINQNAQLRHARAIDLAKTRAAEQRANTQARSEAKIREARARETAKRRTAKYTWDLHAEKANKGSHHP